MSVVSVPEKAVAMDTAATTVKTTSGPITLERPKLRGTDEAFASAPARDRRVPDQRSRVAGDRQLRPGPLGPSTSKPLWARPSDPRRRCPSRRSSRICEAIKVEFEAWRTRDLSDVHLDYLFLDGSHFKFHPGSAAEPVLCAWGITTEGAPVLVGLAPGESESLRRLGRLPLRPRRLGASSRHSSSSPTAHRG